jgi:uncharacterized SAM-binding protein YcdF (DUF218 family)
MERRMKLAIELYRTGVASRVLLSGGGSAVSEAEVMRRLALAAGIPESALLLEPVSRNTHENAIQTARLLGACGVTEVVLVTDRYHALRARILFRLAGLTVSAVHVTAMPLRPGLRMLLSETAKLPFSILRALIDRVVRPRRK